MPSTVELDDELLAELRTRAESEGRPVAAVLADVVRQGLALLRPTQGAADAGRTPAWATFPHRLGEPPVTHAFVRQLQQELEREEDERVVGRASDDRASGAALSEEGVRHFEERIPELAGPAFAQAYQDALDAGSPVLVREGDALVEVRPDGTRRAVRALPPLAAVPPSSPARTA